MWSPETSIPGIDVIYGIKYLVEVLVLGYQWPGP